MHFPTPTVPSHRSRKDIHHCGHCGKVSKDDREECAIPFAFQFTGTPILSISESIKRGDSDIISDFINLYKISPEKVKEFEDPLKLAEYFKEDMKRMAKALGLSVDWRREFTTIDPRFGQFIKWQFRKLKEKGFITTATDAVGYCPNDNFPVGMHDTKGMWNPKSRRWT